MTLDLAEYRRDPLNICPKTEWVGERADEMFPTYLAWIHTVNARISEAIQRDHVYVIQNWSEPSHWEFWVYHPSGDKELIQQAEGEFNRAWIGR
jgi:hypothetical protein